MEIHALWLPLISTVFFFLLTFAANGFKGGEPNSDTAFGLGLLTGMVALISIIIYVVAGLIWLFSNITIVS